MNTHQYNGGEEDVCYCPSFNTYTSNRLAETAIRVAGSCSGAAADSGGDNFEFVLAREDNEVSASEIIYSGPVFPVFNRDLIESGGAQRLESNKLVPLSKLFAEEDGDDDDRNFAPSCSSSEADELESIPAGTYCVWRPRIAEAPAPSQCRKSKSTGSASKRWKFRDLMRRSKSNGKESFVFLTPKHREEKSDRFTIQAPKKGNGRVQHSEAPSLSLSPSASAHEAFYVRNRAMKEGDKRKSYLPYRRDLVGFFANVNGVRRSFSHF